MGPVLDRVAPRSPLVVRGPNKSGVSPERNGVVMQRTRPRKHTCSVRINLEPKTVAMLDAIAARRSSPRAVICREAVHRFLATLEGEGL